MSGNGKYRWPTIVVAGTALTLAAFCIWFEFAAYNDYRSRDFTLASGGFVGLPDSCVEAATDKQLKASKYDQTGWTCSTDSKNELTNLLMASAHALSQATLTGEADKVKSAVLLAIAGGTPAYKIGRAAAYEALAAAEAPASTLCSAIHSGTEGTLTAVGTISVECDDVVTAAGTQAADDASTATADILLTHCMNQFAYGRAFPDTGTLTIPLVGKEPKPALFPVMATNSTTAHVDVARILVGTRWGYAAPFYVVLMMGTAFFLMDATILLLAELTRVDAYFAQNAITQGSGRSMKEGMMTMLATFQAKRNFRWAIALIILLLEITLWVVLIGVPWGFGLNFKRPVCEPGAAEHWITPVYQTTYGGWKDDYDASALEVVVVVAHGLIAIAVPISEMVQRGGGRQGRRGRTGGGQVEGYTGVAVGSLRSAWWFAALAVGALVFYVGQAVAGFRFGIAWAEGIAMGKHDEVVVGTMLYDHVNAVLYMSLTVGLTLASIIGRWLLAGLSCTSFTIFLLWVGLTLGAFIPPFFVSSYWLFFKFEDSQGQKDCQSIFGDSNDFLFARTACDVRAGTYIAGIALILAAVLGPIVIGLIDYSRVVCLPRRRAWVSMPKYWANLVAPQNPKYQTLAQAVPAEELVPLQGTTSGAQTGFFKFTTRLSAAQEPRAVV